MTCMFPIAHAPELEDLHKLALKFKPETPFEDRNALFNFFRGNYDWYQVDTHELDLNIPVEAQKTKYPAFDVYRRALRYVLLEEALIDKAELKLELTFSGYGDSGQIDEYSGDERADILLSAVTDFGVTWDWYNNDGGGGTITWRVLDDEIDVSGYWNETIEQSADGCTF